MAREALLAGVWPGKIWVVNCGRTVDPQDLFLCAAHELVKTLNLVHKGEVKEANETVLLT